MTRYEQEFYRDIKRIAVALETMTTRETMTNLQMKLSNEALEMRKGLEILAKLDKNNPLKKYIDKNAINPKMKLSKVELEQDEPNKWSECCGALLVGETDLCSKCKEHTGQ